MLKWPLVLKVRLTAVRGAPGPTHAGVPPLSISDERHQGEEMKDGPSTRRRMKGVAKARQRPRAPHSSEEVPDGPPGNVLPTFAHPDT